MCWPYSYLFLRKKVLQVSLALLLHVSVLFLECWLVTCFNIFIYACLDYIFVMGLGCFFLCVWLRSLVLPDVSWRKCFIFKYKETIHTTHLSVHNVCLVVLNPMACVLQWAICIIEALKGLLSLMCAFECVCAHTHMYLFWKL